jgi:hypothetical protein
MFPCPSPKGSNFAGLYLNRAGHLVDRNGALWGRRGTMAMDSLPDSLSSEPSTELGPWHDEVTRRAMRGDENDEERGVEALRKYLRTHTGLAEEAIDEACELCEQAISERGEVSDELPVAAPRGYGGRLSGQERKVEGRAPLGTISPNASRSTIGEADYRSSPASDGFEFPKENLTPHYEPPESERRLSARDRRLARDSASGSASDQHFREMFPNAPGVGEWLPRRW